MNIYTSFFLLTLQRLFYFSNKLSTDLIDDDCNDSMLCFQSFSALACHA